MITTPFTFNWFEDALVVVLDAITLAFVIHRIFVYRNLEGRWLLLYVRAAFGVVAVAMGYQIASSGARLLGDPLDSDFQSGWALKDFGLFMYITAFALIQRTISMTKAPAYNPEDLKRVKLQRPRVIDESYNNPRREQ